MSVHTIPNIMKVASNQSTCSKNWWKVRIVGRDRTKTKCSIAVRGDRRHLIRNYLVTIKMTLDRCFVWEILAENNAARKFTITSPFLLILLKYNTLIYTNKGTLLRLSMDHLVSYTRRRVCIMHIQQKLQPSEHLTSNDIAALKSQLSFSHATMQQRDRSSWL